MNEGRDFTLRNSCQSVPGAPALKAHGSSYLRQMTFDSASVDCAVNVIVVKNNSPHCVRKLDRVYFLHIDISFSKREEGRLQVESEKTIEFNILYSWGKKVEW